MTEYIQGTGPQEGRTVTGCIVYRGPVEDLRRLYIFGDFISANLRSVSFASFVHGSSLPNSAYTVRNTAFAPDGGSIVQVVNFGADIAGNLHFMPLGGSIFRPEPLP